MKGIDIIAPTLERSAVVQETLRIFEVCDGCRRCFNLCPSFNTLFERIDAGDSDLSKLAPHDFEQVADECYYCKLCYNHCPYTPPHQYEIDFRDRKSTRLNSSHGYISYAVFCLKKKKK